jgi:putative tricarboxylic transport membrane protein
LNRLFRGTKTKKKDFFPNLFCLLFSINFCIESYSYGLGNWKMPGPGFFPFGAGLVFGILSLYLTVKGRLPDPSRTKEVTHDLSEHPKWGLMATIVGGMFAYALFLQSLGFALCTFFFVLLCLRGIAKRHWSGSLVVALSVAVGSHLLFNVILNAQIPNGILTFLRR